MGCDEVPPHWFCTSAECADPHADTPCRYVRKEGWWVISDKALRAMLQRVADGEDPELVYIEEYANCEHERTTGE